MTVGIVLAGGRSSRFGRDKLAEPVAGEPLLWHPIRALTAAGCDVIVVVLGPGGAEPRLPTGVSVAVRFARDPEPFGGPLVGLRAGLAALAPAGAGTAIGAGSAAGRGIAIVVGGDQPSIRPEVLAALVARVRAGAPAAVLADDDGRARPLPMALAALPGAEATERLLAAGHRRLRDLSADLRADVIDRPAWSLLDPTGRTLVDIDVPADLVEPDRG